MDTTLGLAGRVAVVTGGTRGVGLAIARKLAGSGCHVYANYARDDAAATQAADGASGLPGSFTVHRGDAADPATLGALADRAVEQHGRLDIFVHNAASWRPMSALAPDVDALWADVQIALNPLLRTAGRLAAAMAGGPGRIVAVSSAGARATIPAYVSQGVAKAALESLVRYLAVELAPKGVTVNAVSTAKIDKGTGTSNPEAARALAARTPAGRLTTPDDVADAVSLLCTDEAGFIHGQVLTVDGGLGLRT